MENASEKDERAAVLRKLSTETFPGEAMRGGWRPVLLRINNERSVQIDWICPGCKHLTCGMTRCPTCGLGVLEKPIGRSGMMPHGQRIRSYRDWITSVLYDAELD